MNKYIMATIFSDVLNVLGTAFRGAASSDFVRDYRHATELFVGNDFSLLPKSGYLFHVFFDINPFAAHSQLLDPTRSTEIGMLVKSVDLPRFSIEQKTYNSYNRPNIVQTKVKYDPVTLVFRDDSVNLIRNFWFDYYSYYYKDTLNMPELHRQDYKYNPNSPSSFGYSLRADLPDYKYLQSIRIYSLTHNQFSEYLLVNPTVNSFRHPQHDYESNESAGMTHEMSVNYEGVFYSEGFIEDGGVKGFATLHYDRTRSPLNRVGTRRSIFGRGGLINTASSIITDITKGNYLSAIFKFATARQTFKGVNIAKAAKSEVKQIFTQTATNAVTGLITQQMRSTTPGGYTVPSPLNVPGVTSVNGITQVGSVLALAGAAALLNRGAVTKKYTRDPIVRTGVNNNYNPRFPTVPGGSVPVVAPGTIIKANDAAVLLRDTNQKTIDMRQRVVDINSEIASLEITLRQQSQTQTALQTQINNLVIQIANLNNTLTVARNAGASQQIIDDILQRITAATTDKQKTEAKLTETSNAVRATQSTINQKIVERNAVNG